VIWTAIGFFVWQAPYRRLVAGLQLMLVL